MYKAVKRSDENHRSRAVAHIVAQRTPVKRHVLGLVDNRPEALLQRKLQETIHGRSHKKLAGIGLLQRFRTGTNGVIQRGKGYYAYGSGNSIPHVHVYSGGDCHLKIMDRNKVRRYNIIQNGKRHSQADDALNAATGNQTLIDAINKLLE